MPMSTDLNQIKSRQTCPRYFGLPLRSCWGMVSLASLVGIVATTFVYGYVTSQVSSLTSDKRSKLPVVEISPERLAAIELQIDRVSKSIQNQGIENREFFLAAEEINTLLHKEPRLRNAIVVKIENDVLKADVSLPADSLPGGQGRFFNAEVIFSASVDAGKLNLTVAEASIDGESVSDVWINQIKGRNFAKPLYNDREIANLLENLERVEVEPNGIRFVLTGAANLLQASKQTDNPQFYTRLR